MKQSYKVTVMCLSLLSVFNVGAEEPKKVGDDIETITILGERSLEHVKASMLKKEKDFYAKYNELTAENKFRIVCSNNDNSGSVYAKKRCEPYGLKKLLSRYGRDPQILIGKIQKLRSEQEAYLTKLLEEHPELDAQYDDYVAQKRSYRKKRKEKFK